MEQNIDVECLIYDLKDQLIALEALDQLLCVSSHHKQPIDNGGIAKLIRAIKQGAVLDND